VSDMTDGSNIDGGLARDDLGIQGRDLGDVKVFECLRRQVILSNHIG